MIVCVCRNVSDRAICRLIAEGAGTVEDVAARSGAGTGCGGCRVSLARLVAERRSDEPPGIAFTASAA